MRDPRSSGFGLFDLFEHIHGKGDSAEDSDGHEGKSDHFATLLWDSVREHKGRAGGEHPSGSHDKTDFW